MHIVPKIVLGIGGILIIGGLIGVIIHEVGHFWFPMIVNSDER